MSVTTAICWTEPLEHSVLIAVHPDGLAQLLEESRDYEIEILPTLAEAQLVLKQRLTDTAVELMARTDAVLSRVAMIDLKLTAMDLPTDVTYVDVDSHTAEIVLDPESEPEPPPPPPEPVMPDPDDSDAWERFTKNENHHDLRWTGYR